MLLRAPLVDVQHLSHGVQGALARGGRSLRSMPEAAFQLKDRRTSKARSYSSNTRDCGGGGADSPSLSYLKGSFEKSCWAAPD